MRALFSVLILDFQDIIVLNRLSRVHIHKLDSHSTNEMSALANTPQGYKLRSQVSWPMKGLFSVGVLTYPIPRLGR